MQRSMTRTSSALAVIAAAALCTFAGVAMAAIPEGFTPIFDGKTLKGWHVSRTSHHGTDPHVFVKDGAIQIGQNPYAEGGILLTDKHYENFELYLEANPDLGCDGGVFLRSSEAGNAYQVTIDNLGPMINNGSLISEMRKISRGARNQSKAWKQGEWNALLIRVTGGDTPRLTLSINGEQVWDVQQDRSEYFTDALGGSIALQSHFNASWPGGLSPRWAPDRVHRFRNIAIRELDR